MNEKALALGKNRSVIREIFEYANKRKSEIGADNVFDFSLGNPSVLPPKVVNDQIINLVNSDSSVHAYTSAVGDKSVREAIAKHVFDTQNYPQDPNLIYLTCGAAASLVSVLGAILNEGDEVILFAPYFPEYKVFIESAGGVVKVIECDEPNFSLPVNKLKSAITTKTRAVILNSPNNPSGVVVGEDELKALADTLLKYKGIYLISDEPYRELCYNKKVPFVPHFYKNTVVCYSFSKSLSLPGERIGYVMVPQCCENASDLFYAICGAARMRGYVCAPSLMQRVIKECLGQTADVSVYKTNRDLLYSALCEMGYTVTQPDGAFYLFLKAPESDAVAFCERAKKFELMLVPSDDFGIKGWVRISYCVETDMIKRSLEKFKLLLEEYK